MSEPVPDTVLRYLTERGDHEQQNMARELLAARAELALLRPIKAAAEKVRRQRVHLPACIEDALDGLSAPSPPAAPEPAAVKPIWCGAPGDGTSKLCMQPLPCTKHGPFAAPEPAAGRAGDADERDKRAAREATAFVWTRSKIRSTFVGCYEAWHSFPRQKDQFFDAIIDWMMHRVVPESVRVGRDVGEAERMNLADEIARLMRQNDDLECARLSSAQAAQGVGAAEADAIEANLIGWALTAEKHRLASRALALADRLREPHLQALLAARGAAGDAPSKKK